MAVTGCAEKNLSSSVRVDKSAAERQKREMWQADIVAFHGQREDTSEEIRRLRRELHRIVNIGLIFQGVIFTAVSQSKSLTCFLSWSPISLSIMVALASCFAMTDKLYAIGELEEDLNHIDANVSAIFEAQGKLDLCLNINTVHASTNFKFDQFAGWRKVCSKFGFSLLLFFLIFSSSVAFFSYKALCHGSKDCGS